MNGGEIELNCSLLNNLPFVNRRFLEQIGDILSLDGVNFLERDFKKFFSVHGYSTHDSLPIIPLSHRSLLFTNSAIVSLLEKIRKGEAFEKYSISQPCIRLQNLREDHNDLPRYMSCFHMLGVFDRFENYNHFCDLVLIYLKRIINHSYIKIAIDKSQLDHLIYWMNQGIEFIEHPNNYYNWKFGLFNIDGGLDESMINVKGKGVSIMFKKGDIYEELGNIIIIYINGIPTYVVFGYGIETFLSIIGGNNKIHQVEFTGLNPEIFELLCYNRSNPRHIRLIDCLNILFNLSKIGILPGRGKHRGIATKTLNTFIKLANELNISTDIQYKLLLLINQPNIILYFKRRIGKNQNT